MKNLDIKNKNTIFILLGVFLIVTLLFVYKKIEENKIEFDATKQVINLEKDEIDDYDIIDITDIKSEIITLDNEEAIRFTLTYKNTTDKTIGIEPNISIVSDLHGGQSYYDDEFRNRLEGRVESFAKEKGIDVKEFKKNNYKPYEEEYSDYINIFLEPNEEIEVTFTPKKSEIFNNLFDKKDINKLNNVSINDVMNLEYMELGCGYKYKLEENQKYVEINYSKYPNSDWNVYGYIK